MLNLIIEDELTEGRNMLCPFHQDEQLLLHTLSYVWDVGQSLCADVVICQLIANFIPVVALRSIVAGVITLICTFYLPGKYLCVQQSLHREATVANHCVLEARSSFADPVPFILNSIFLHSGLEALPQATVAALVPLILVHRAVARKPTAVCMLLSNTPSKKSFAAVARSCSIVFSCSSVSTYGTVGWNDSTLQMVTIIHLCILKYNWNYCQHSFLILTWDPFMWWKSTGELDWSRSAMSSQCSFTKLNESKWYHQIYTYVLN